MLHVIVDGANVVGSRPDGWWRDRQGAARRLAGRLAAALTVDPARLADDLGPPDADLQVHLVLEGAAARAEDLPTHPRLAVVHAEADGDAAIAALAAELAAGDEPVLVVTADRALRERVRATGATTLGPGALLDALPAA
ncbi:MAG TPA: hypothetical protein VD903_08710 [Pseudonocardia sp.]|nr:hypothetical protein [Pseudonocardia sp.]